MENDDSYVKNKKDETDEKETEQQTASTVSSPFKFTEDAKRKLEELKEKEDWEICAYCGEDSRTEYKELRRYELLYPNDVDTNLEIKKKV